MGSCVESEWERDKVLTEAKKLLLYVWGEGWALAIFCVMETLTLLGQLRVVRCPDFRGCNTHKQSV